MFGTRVAAVVALGLALTGCAWFGGDDKKVDAAYPKLGDVPARPGESETQAQRHDLAKGLIADRDEARYTDQALRGGTEAAAPPPPAAAPSALAALPETAGADASAAPGSDTAAVPAAEAKKEKRGFFARLFGRKEKAHAEGPAPLPASPTAPVDVAPSQDVPADSPASKTP